MRPILSPQRPRPRWISRLGGLALASYLLLACWLLFRMAYDLCQP